jgi:cell division protein FtsB
MAISGARPAGGIAIFGRPRLRPRTVAPPRRRPAAGRRARRVSGISGALVTIAAAAGLALFYLSQSSHVAATGYEIAGLQAQLAELRAEQQQLVFQIGEARSPAVITRRARGQLDLIALPAHAVTFAKPSTNPR